jgi:chemotaxis protein methyltransferase CheR
MPAGRTEVEFSLPDLSPEEFDRIRLLARERFGMDLRQGKQELVKARLGKLIRNNGFTSFGHYIDHIVSDRSGESLLHLIDALTTNYTSFLREPAHFDFLVQQLLATWKDRRYVRIWSAACATGEEPYSIACALLDRLGPASGLQFQILATDISTRALAAAEQGVYPADRLRDVPAAWLSRFFLKGYGRREGHFKIRPEVRSRVEFRRLNLIEPFSHPEPFALIVCRNVMIYFDRPVRQLVVERLCGCLEPGGYLFVGHAESLAGLRSGLQYVRPAIYRKPSTAEAASATRRNR